MERNTTTRPPAARNAGVVFEGLHATGELRGLGFEVQAELRFRNQGKRHVELVYTYPLPWDATLLGIEAELGELRLRGTVVARSAAEAGYEQAIADGNASIMVEKNAERSYTLSLGNMAPGETCVVRLHYAQVLSFTQRSLRLQIPTTIAPRYGDTPFKAALPQTAPAASPTAEYPFTMKVSLHGAMAHARVASPGHATSVTSDGSILTVALAREAAMDRDFVLVVDQFDQESVAVAAEDPLHPGYAARLISFCPRLPATAAHAALKILVDCSGSMAGDSIDSARRALASVARKLATGERFSLSRFGNHVIHHRRTTVPVTDISREDAYQWIADLDADLGGTEMARALASTFAIDASEQLTHDVLLITDGEIESIDETIELAKNSGQRLFIVGIGSSPAETHLRRLASASGGACEFVAPGEDVEPAIGRMFARLRSPRLEHVHLQWPAGATPLWVSNLPQSVFDGDTINVFALVPAGAEGTLLLLGSLSGATQMQEVGRSHLAVAEPAAPVSRPGSLARLLASTRIGQDDKQSEGTVFDALKCATDYQLVTSLTSFLLVHERADADRATEMPVLHHMPHMLAAGWGATSTCKNEYPEIRFSKRMQVNEPAPQYAAAPALWRRTESALAIEEARTQEHYAIPAFLRKRVDAAPAKPVSVPPAPAGESLEAALHRIAAHLAATPREQWPADGQELEQMLPPLVYRLWLNINPGKEAAVTPEEIKARIRLFLLALQRYCSELDAVKFGQVQRIVARMSAWAINLRNRPMAGQERAMFDAMLRSMNQIKGHVMADAV